MTEPRRVVVTGIGIVSPCGHDKETAWPAICEGRSAIRPIQSFDASEFDVCIAGEVLDFDARQYVTRREEHRIDRFALFAVAAAQDAVAMAGLGDGAVEPERVGVFIGSGIGGLQEIEAQHTKLLQSGPRRISPLMIPKLMTNAASGFVSIQHGFLGPSMAVSSACASGSNAIGEAFHSIQHGVTDAHLCGGSEAAVTPMGVAGFMQLRALSTRNEEPEKASRPFEKNRDGFVMAEGAAMLILEDWDLAKARGAPILAEICGYGASSDASHMTLPDPEGRGAVKAMDNALRDAGMNPEDISYVNAHGTGTPAGDDIEAKAIAKLFGHHAKTLAISSNKSVFGHLLGASGALESAISIWALQDDVCPPTINLDEVDPECGDLNFVPHVAQQRPVDGVLNNSFGFGGHNVCLVFRKFKG